MRRIAPVATAALLLSVLTLGLFLGGVFSEAQAVVWMGFSLILAVLSLKER